MSLRIKLLKTTSNSEKYTCQYKYTRAHVNVLLTDAKRMFKYNTTNSAWYER